MTEEQIDWVDDYNLEELKLNYLAAVADMSEAEFKEYINGVFKVSEEYASINSNKNTDR